MRDTRQRGYTLVELMIVVAILSVIAGIAIPIYQGYITESRLQTTRMNAEPLRLALEDYYLEEGTYVAGTWIPSGTTSLQSGNLGWRPDGDDNKYRYNVVAGSTGNIATSYNLTVQSVDGSSTIQCARNQIAGTFSCKSL